MTQSIRGVLAPVVTPLKLVRSPLARSYPRHFTLITRTALCLRQLPSLRCRLPARFPIATCSMSLIPSAPFKAHFSHGVLRAGVDVIANYDLRPSVCEKPNDRTNPRRLGPRCHPI